MYCAFKLMVRLSLFFEKQIMYEVDDGRVGMVALIIIIIIISLFI